MLEQVLVLFRPDDRTMSFWKTDSALTENRLGFLFLFLFLNRIRVDVEIYKIKVVAVLVSYYQI